MNTGLVSLSRPSAPLRQGLLGRTYVNVTRPSFLRAQSLDGDHEIARNAGVIAGRKFLAGDRPRAPLHNYTSAAQARRMRRKPKLERMKTERNHPGARERSEVFARSRFANADVAACFIDINFCLCRKGPRANCGCPVAVQRNSKVPEAHQKDEPPCAP